jgi:riboflavin synthase
VDGVSLTVNQVDDTAFEVNVIPHTSDVTIISDYAAGRAVNLEVDIVARYLERLIGESRI